MTTQNRKCGISTYELHLKNKPGEDISGSFEGMRMTYSENGETILSGVVIDQSALYGLLNRIRDLGLILISVKKLKPD